MANDEEEMISVACWGMFPVPPALPPREVFLRAATAYITTMTLDHLGGVVPEYSRVQAEMMVGEIEAGFERIKKNARQFVPGHFH